METGPNLFEIIMFCFVLFCFLTDYTMLSILHDLNSNFQDYNTCNKTMLEFSTIFYFYALVQMNGSKLEMRRGWGGGNPRGLLP